MACHTREPRQSFLFVGFSAVEPRETAAAAEVSPTGEVGMTRRRGAFPCILFDADGVLQTRAPGSLHAGLSGLLPDARCADAVLEEVFAAERTCLAGSRPFTPVLEEVFRRWGHPVRMEQALEVWRAVQVDREVLKLIRRLRASGTRVGLASNQWVERAAFMSGSLGYAEVFDDLFYSCALGAAKPDPAFYRAVLDRLEIPAHRVLFIDDREDNVRAARHAGLAGAIFREGGGAAEMSRVLRSHGVD